MQLKSNNESVSRWCIKYKGIEKCHDLITGTKNFHRDKKFSPGQNLLTGAKLFHRDTIFTAEQFNMEVDNPRKRVLTLISIYKLGDVGISSNLIGPLSLTN